MPVSLIKKLPMSCGRTIISTVLPSNDYLLLYYFEGNTRKDIVLPRNVSECNSKIQKLFEQSHETICICKKLALIP